MISPIFSGAVVARRGKGRKGTELRGGPVCKCLCKERETRVSGADLWAWARAKASGGWGRGRACA